MIEPSRNATAATCVYQVVKASVLALILLGSSLPLRAQHAPDSAFAAFLLEMARYQYQGPAPYRGGAFDCQEWELLWIQDHSPGADLPLQATPDRSACALLRRVARDRRRALRKGQAYGSTWYQQQVLGDRYLRIDAIQVTGMSHHRSYYLRRRTNAPGLGTPGPADRFPADTLWDAPDQLPAMRRVRDSALLTAFLTSPPGPFRYPGTPILPAAGKTWRLLYVEQTYDEEIVHQYSQRARALYVPLAPLRLRSGQLKRRYGDQPWTSWQWGEAGLVLRYLDAYPHGSLTSWQRETRLYFVQDE